MEKETGETVVQDDKKKRKKKIISVIIFVLAIMLALCPVLGCIYLWAPHSSGDFKYKLYWNGHNNLRVTELTKKGRNKEVLIVPQEIKGNEVCGLGLRTGLWGDHSVWKSEKLETLYVWYNYNSTVVFDCPNLEKVFILNITKEQVFGSRSFGAIAWDIKRYIFNEIYFDRAGSGFTLPANVTYCYNFEGAENYGCYWLDNLEDGEKITYIPAAPTREGYKFAGWYHEPECENEWNFETDTVRASDEEAYKDEASFIENRLYAKWLKE